MLADPLVVKSLDGDPATAVTVLNTNSYAIIDAGPGRSVRRCAAPTFAGQNAVRPATLTISHSVSNENSPVKTDRALIRFDFPLEDASGREVKAFAYAVIGIPQGALKADPSDNVLTASELRNNLVGALTGCMLSSESAATFDEAKMTRILAGES